MHHIDNRQQADSEQDVHGRPCDRNDEAMPARMRQEFPGIAAARIHRVLAAHLYITTQRQRVDAIFSLALAKPDQLLAETNGELFHPDAKQFSHGVVSKFVDQDHESEDGYERDCGNKELRHDLSINPFAGLPKLAPGDVLIRLLFLVPCGGRPRPLPTLLL